MTPQDALKGVSRIGLDTTPIIYFVERNPEFYARTLPFFEAIDSQVIEGFTSTISLCEVLSHPLKNSDLILATAFRNLLRETQGIASLSLSTTIAEETARLRANYGLRTPDAAQIATALFANCEAFLTNDIKLKRVTEIRVIVLSDLTV